MDTPRLVAPSSLPHPRTPLVGRDQELAAARAFLLDEAVPLLTLTGPGGVGKTRLALAIAQEVVNEFSDGTHFLSFASILDPALVPTTVARALGIPDIPGHDPLDQVTTALGGQKILLILDNLEHLLPAASWVAALLRVCPRLKVMVTSRERLRVGGEHEVAVPPLSLPDLATHDPSGTIAESNAVRLFTVRAQASAPDFALTSDNAMVIAEICRRLDGLPLAIELAASRVKILPPVAMLARLEKRLPLLIGGNRDAPARQQTMRDCIAWSYGLLSDEEQTLFRRLAVFVGSFTLESAAMITAGTDRSSIGELFNPEASNRRLPISDILAVVASLCDKSLVHRIGHPGHEPRFAMLETVREYALEQVHRHGESEALRERHAQFFLDWVERIEPHLEIGSRGAWLQELTADHDNLRAALTWSQEDPDRGEFGLRMASALFWFWYIQGHLAEGRRAIETSLADTPKAASPLVRAGALYASGRLAWRQGDFDHACAQLEESVSLWRSLGDRRRLAHTLSFFGLAARYVLWDSAITRSLQAESVMLFREIGDQWGLALALYNLADNYGLGWYDPPRDGVREGDEADFGVASAFYAESLGLFHDLGDAWGEALVLTSMGRMARLAGDHQNARPHLERGLDLLLDAGDIWRSAQALTALGLLAEERGHYGEAACYLGSAVERYRTLGHRQGLAETFDSLARVARQVGEAALAGELAEDAASVQHDTILACMPEPELNRAIKRLADRAASCTDLSPSRRDEPEASSRLSPREREVLRLVAAGQSNVEVATTLFISRRTVSTHVGHMLSKLDLATRSELIAFAHRQGLA